MPLTPSQQQELQELRRIDELEAQLSSKQAGTPWDSSYAEERTGSGVESPSIGEMERIVPPLAKGLARGTGMGLYQPEIAGGELEKAVATTGEVAGAMIPGMGISKILSKGARVLPKAKALLEGRGLLSSTARVAEGVGQGYVGGAAYAPEGEDSLKKRHEQGKLGALISGGVTSVPEAWQGIKTVGGALAGKVGQLGRFFAGGTPTKLQMAGQAVQGMAPDTTTSAMAELQGQPIEINVSPGNKSVESIAKKHGVDPQELQATSALSPTEKANLHRRELIKAHRAINEEKDILVGQQKQIKGDVYLDPYGEDLPRSAQPQYSPRTTSTSEEVGAQRSALGASLEREAEKQGTPIMGMPEYTDKGVTGYRPFEYIEPGTPLEAPLQGPHPGGIETQPLGAGGRPISYFPHPGEVETAPAEQIKMPIQELRPLLTESGRLSRNVTMTPEKEAQNVVEASARGIIRKEAGEQIPQFNKVQEDLTSNYGISSLLRPYRKGRGTKAMPPEVAQEIDAYTGSNLMGSSRLQKALKEVDDLMKSEMEKGARSQTVTASGGELILPPQAPREALQLRDAFSGAFDPRAIPQATRARDILGREDKKK